MNKKQFNEIAEALAMEAFLAARKIPGISDAMAYDVKDAVMEKAREIGKTVDERSEAK